ncbi:MAG: putative sensor domain DACNV-containing protein [Myxococcota bacterium]
MSGAYPPDLARVVVEQWPVLFEAACPFEAEELATVLDECFLASLLTEEGRPTRVRVLLASPESLAEDGVPNHSAWRVAFEEPRPLTAHELRRLGPASPFERTLIGARFGSEGAEVWGLAQSGADWLAPSWGGRRDRREPWTSAPIVHVTGPGRIAVRGSGRLIAALERGRVVTQTIDVFSSAWLPALFASARSDVRRNHLQTDESLIATVSQHMVRRAISLIRSRGHGGMILFADPEVAERYRRGDGALRTKYRFALGEPRERYQTLMARLLETATRISDNDGAGFGWREFEQARDRALDALERQVFEVSNLVASLAAIDGAVLLDKWFRLIGFGVEVSAELTPPTRVLRAGDLEGRAHFCEPVHSVGTRHRAAYRYIQTHPTGLAIVVSQDGSVRFVAMGDAGVTYWEQYLSP